MAKRPRFSRWRRLPRVYRSGEFKLPNANAEPQRLTLYLPDELLEAAEQQATRAQIDTVQEYCAELLSRAIEGERVREQVADVEAKRGPLEGLQEIANDPEYLAEWSAQAASAPPEPTVTDPLRMTAPTPTPPPPVISIPLAPSPDSGPPLAIPDATDAGRGPSVIAPGRATPISHAGLVILRHAGQGDEAPSSFLPSLRRGESISVDEVAELARALQTLEMELHEADMLNRRVAFALHRLAYEGQILHTDAWPGMYDDWTVDTLHAVQEAVERILSGQDIRYYPTHS